MAEKKCKTLFLIGIIFTLFFLGTFIQVDCAEAVLITQKRETATVKSGYLNIRTGPGMGFSKIDRVSKGQQFSIIKKSGGWYNVSLDSAKDGWIAGWLVDVNDASQETDYVTSRYLLVKESIVNIRSGPGTGYEIVSKTRAGEQFSILSQEDQWYQIITSDGSSGWIAGWLVEVHALNTPSRDGNDLYDHSGPQPEEPEITETEEPETTETEEPETAETDPDTNIHVLKDIDFIRVDGKETIVIESEGEITYKLFTLKNPERLVIDIENTDINDIKDFDTDGRYVEQIRVAQFSLTPMVVRVVIDLNMTSAYKPVLNDEGRTLKVTITEPSIKDKVIVIDPGHGGYDPGAIGVSGLEEKGFNLETALLLKNNLEALGAEVILTRDDDTFISLTGRAVIANEVYADVFVSIHANASEQSFTNGTSTYFYAPSSDPVLYAQYAERRQLAGFVQNRLADSLETRDIGVLQSNLAVLRNTKMPSILVEAAFLSNAADERLLKKQQFREEVAQGIAEGLLDYFAAGN
ncbi:N-acetylmuramoyl-L-alanine amidase [Phosphitispora sp. TUW77]|uniref:N-acetylmuramoyl-L-alanine amidase n=1 Tax=Phosphitispora sp. TUW77 TaxID=3152361 RepID=UPI003AB47AA8